MTVTGDVAGFKWPIVVFLYFFGSCFNRKKYCNETPILVTFLFPQKNKKKKLKKTKGICLKKEHAFTTESGRELCF